MRAKAFERRGVEASQLQSLRVQLEGLPVVIRWIARDELKGHEVFFAEIKALGAKRLRISSSLSNLIATGAWQLCCSLAERTERLDVRESQTSHRQTRQKPVAHQQLPGDC